MATKTRTEKFEIKNRFTGAVMFVAALTCSPDTAPEVKLGMAVKEAVASGADLSGAYLSGANLSRADLSGAYLSGANLSRADLSGADLSGAYLSGAYLSGADLSGADLSGANLSGANLSGADLSGANLSGAYLSRANLSGADLSGADLSGAYLSGAYLSGAKNLSEESLRTFKADLFLTLDSLHVGPLEAQHLIAKLRAGQVDGSTYGRGEVTACDCLVGTIAQPRGVSGEALDHNSDRPAERWFMMIRPGDKPGAVDAEGKPTGGGYAAQKALDWCMDWCACHGVDLEAVPAEEVAS